MTKVEIWTGVTDPLRPDSLTTLKDGATQLLIKYMSGALVMQKEIVTPTIQCRPFAPLSAKSEEAHSSHFTCHTTYYIIHKHTREYRKNSFNIFLCMDDMIYPVRDSFL